MLHWQVKCKPGHNYGVAPCSTNEGVLIQLTEDGEQARIRLDKSEVDHLISLLQKAKQEVYG